MNLILSIGLSYTKDVYLPLIESIKKINKNNLLKLVLLTDLEEDDFNEYDFIEVINIKKNNFNYNDQQLLPVVCRYNYYKKYLNNYLQNASEIQSILFVDVRDVLFQNTKIFDSIDKNKIYLFKENNNYTFGNEHWHQVWFDAIERNDFIKKFCNETFYCSGVHLFGSLEMAFIYLEAFDQELQKYKKYKWHLNDQALHNILIYEEILPSNILYKYETELTDKLFTMGLCNEEDYVIHENKLYYQYNFIEPSIIHQYDRRLDRTKDLIQ